MNRFSLKNIACLCILALLLSACGSGRSQQASAPFGGAQGEGVYKVGTPYEVKGNTYFPQEDYSYDQTGIASWYGSDFHGGRTANGEIYNKNELTAAHKTLPLPTLARVTNLDNGRSIVVRINDRGPFASNRIIDMSQRGAQLLGFEQQGTAKVRVQVLADESKAIADAMRRYGSKPVTVASAGNLPLGNTASVVPVTSEPLAAPSPESAQLSPTKTTPEVHQQLLATKPVQEVIQVEVKGSSQIYVQAGAFTMVDNAQRLKQKLSSYGNAAMTEAMVKGTKFYRVRVGPVGDVAQADMLLAKIERAGIAHPRIVID